MLIHGQRGPELTPDSLFLQSKGEMATARGRHYCPKVKTFVWRVFRNFCPGIVRVVILIRKYNSFYLEDRSRVIKYPAKE